MTRTAIHHTLSAFAAVALVSAVAGSSASAQNTVKGNANYVGETQLSKETPKGLATKKGHSQRAQQNPDYDYAMITINRNLGQKTPKGLATKQKRPVACDCTNCSASHCNLDFYEDFVIWGNNGSR